MSYFASPFSYELIPMSYSPLTKLTISETLGIDRINEPVTVGIPFPRGMLKEGFVLSLRDPEAGVIPVQTQTLATWTDGSAKWVLLDFQVSVKRGTTKELEIFEGVGGSRTEIPGAVVVEEKDDCLCVRTGVSSHFMNRKIFKPFDSVLFNETEVLDGEKSRTVLSLEDGTEYEPIIEKLFCETAGHMRTTLKAEGVFKSSDKKVFSRFFSRLHFFANRSMVKVEFTIHNPRAAKHPGGLWDLGDPASIFFKDLSLHFSLATSDSTPHICYCLNDQQPATSNQQPSFYELSPMSYDLVYGTSEPLDGSSDQLTSYRSPLTVNESPLTAHGSPLTGNLVIYQDSSGGENWKSKNHVNRNGEVKNSFRGYRVYSGEKIISEGNRANPVISLEGSDKRISGAIQYFWQNFPKALEINDNSLTMRLFPKHYNDVFELQGGEQKTHTFYLDFSMPVKAVNESANGLQLTACEGNIPGLQWIQAPLIAHASPKWYAESNAFYYLIPESEDTNREVVDLINTAIEGENTFFDRREIIDEYGWRNFGEFYADHEAVFQNRSSAMSHELSSEPSAMSYELSPERPSYELSAHGSPLTADELVYSSQLSIQQPATSNQPLKQPLVSHYNNQYDCINGSLTQFIRSGNPKWFILGDQLCRHVKDIDIYHTIEDRPGFNRGLFWHTEHYLDAQTGTHRCFSKNHASYRNLASYGGGPSLSHNYSSGLLLHYYLSGECSSTEAMLDLASFVENNLAMESTISNHLFQKLKGIKSYLENRSRKNAFVEIGKVYGLDGPGRASGNALNTLLDTYSLTKDDKYLDLAGNLVKQCVSPEDDLAKMDLLDTENRWMYTVFLQSLGKYLDVTGEASKETHAWEYAKKTLIHFARWMTENESLYLDRPEKLEFPNETWPAQDIRKCNILLSAAMYGKEETRTAFWEKAGFFFDGGIRQLVKYNTATLTRPIALLMQNGMIYGYWKSESHEPVKNIIEKVENKETINLKWNKSVTNIGNRLAELCKMEKLFWKWNILYKLKN